MNTKLIKIVHDTVHRISKSPRNHAGNYAKYNSMVDSYNAKYHAATERLNSYNADVDKFNFLVEQIRNYG